MMTPKFMQLLEQCIADGVVIGHNRAYKHTDNPSKTQIHESIVNEVLFQIHQWFDFDDAKEKDA
jgi:hypothetical protein